ISDINASIIQSFSNFKTGTEILHAVLGQLVIYYTRFHNLYDKYLVSQQQHSRQGTAMAVPVKVKNVMIEVKKYRSNF
ncbi:Vacuolar protein sorting-associated protein 52, partial [Spiromyces aspiralis]